MNTEKSITVYLNIRQKFFEETPTLLSETEVEKEVLDMCHELSAIDTAVILTLVMMDHKKLFRNVVAQNSEKRVNAKREILGQKGAGPLVSRFFDENSDIGKFGRA